MESFDELEAKILNNMLKNKNRTKNILNQLIKCKVKTSVIQDYMQCCDYVSLYYHNKTLFSSTSFFCKNWKLCPRCSLNRAYKFKKKILNIIEKNEWQNKNYYYIVLTIKHTENDSMIDIYNKIKKSMLKIRKYYNHQKEELNRASDLSLFEGFMYSYELTYTAN